MANKLFYAGIGARVTPPEVLQWMTNIAMQMAPRWHLISGYSGNADLAFGRGAELVNGPFTMFLPWEGFNDAPTDDPRFVCKDPDLALVTKAAETHPNWDRCTEHARLFHIRNIALMVNGDFEERHNWPKLLICYTPNGREEGGTGQAMRFAKANDIPVFNLYHHGDRVRLTDFVNNYPY